MRKFLPPFPDFIIKESPFPYNRINSVRGLATLWETIVERVKKEGNYIIEKGCTVRACAKEFCTSKSTVHKDVTERLRSIDSELFQKVQAVLKKNLSERHIRGGNATRQKYLLLKQKRENAG
ncbi:MAG: sporulation transcriptional regulator SpoIIID [Clostridia bacterium]|nr:sporulation transcriptional regulator SpoIIID [Clostridia bacterium]